MGLQYTDTPSAGRRWTPGRAEDRETLDEQLVAGLEDSFPCSDPISVTSSLISGCPKDKKEPVT
jgi:hypothetical protein